MKSTEKRVVFPDELLEGMSIESTIFSPGNEKVGIATLSEEQDAQFVLRIYLLIQKKDEKYHLKQELAAFSFKSRKELDEFLVKLPNLSGLEMLLLLNPMSGEFN